MENKENIVARMVDSKFFMPIIIVFLAFTAYYLWADIKAYRDLEQEDFDAYIKMVGQREIKTDRITPQDVDYVSPQKCPYLVSRYNYCTFDNFGNNGEAVLTEYYITQGRGNHFPEKLREIHYIKTNIGKISVEVINTNE